MILDHKDDLPAFRHAVHDWLADVVPADWPERMAHADDEGYVAFQRWWMDERIKAGLAIAEWPVAYGGAALTIAQQIIIAEEFARANAPTSPMFLISLRHLPATLLAHGSEAQRARYLPGVLRRETWCQGFSEPNAGSDLAALGTRAARNGDHYVVNGQKIWSSFSRHADFCLLLARTDPAAPKRAGISFFILDMRTPGVEVRPIRQANGRAEFGEIFLSDVHIPAENLIGAENAGWTVAQATLAAERGLLAFELSERQYNLVDRFYRQAVADRAAWLGDDQHRRRFITLHGEIQAGRRLIRRLLNEADGHASADAMTAILVKLTESTLQQRVGDFMVEIGGLNSRVFTPGFESAAINPMFDHISSYGWTISAGTNEIMRNILAERALGLPR